MKILVLNCGSSSIKYKLFDMTTKEGTRWYRKNRSERIILETYFAEW